MKFYKDFEQAFKQIISTVTSVKTCEPYNQQYDNTDNEKVIVYPAVYFEFQNEIQWQQLGTLNEQYGSVTLDLHIVVNNHLDSLTELYNVANDVHVRLQGLAIQNVDQSLITSPFVRNTSQIDKRFTMLKVMRVTYQFSGYETQDPQTVNATINAFQINS